jgi:LemA protein
MVWLIVGGAVLLLALIIVIWWVATYNSLIKNKNQVEEGFSTMDVQMKKRSDLVPNLVATVKGYAKHENDTLEKVIAARSKYMSADSPEAKMEAQNQITGALGRLFALSESYPELKANTNFMSLQTDLNGLEKDIANARQYYNGCVKIYNNLVQMFPSNIVARHYKGEFQKQPMFQIAEADRANVKVEF